MLSGFLNILLSASAEFYPFTTKAAKHSTLLVFDYTDGHVLSMELICSLAFILKAAMLKLRWSTSSRGNLSVKTAGHWYGGGAMGCTLWFMTWGGFRKPWLWYPVCRPCAGPMRSGIACIGVVLVRGDPSQGSMCSELLIGLMLVCIGGRLKESMGESWSFTTLASIFSWRLHLARRFWNHTWIKTWTLETYITIPLHVLSWDLQDVSLFLATSLIWLLFVITVSCCAK